MTITAFFYSQSFTNQSSVCNLKWIFYFLLLKLQCRVRTINTKQYSSLYLTLVI